MRIALYIDNGIEQIVLTPQTSTEKGILGKLLDPGLQMTVRRGSFYECIGGYMRQGANDESTMIVLQRAPTPEER